MSLNDAVTLIKQGNLDEFKTDRAIEELIFTGLVSYQNKFIKVTNMIYWEYIRNFVPLSPSLEEVDEKVWKMIKKAELLLRVVVKKKYEARWTNDWQDKVIKTLSPDEQKKLQRTIEDIAKQYPLSPRNQELDLLDYFYLGQLINSIVYKAAWDMFMHMFRDQRALEDIRKAISPVRNDIAHYRSAPLKELERCRIACDDLIVILEMELNSDIQ